MLGKTSPAFLLDMNKQVSGGPHERFTLQLKSYVYKDRDSRKLNKPKQMKHIDRMRFVMFTPISHNFIILT